MSYKKCGTIPTLMCWINIYCFGIKNTKIYLLISFFVRVNAKTAKTAKNKNGQTNYRENFISRKKNRSDQTTTKYLNNEWRWRMHTANETNADQRKPNPILVHHGFEFSASLANFMRPNHNHKNKFHLCE